MDGIIHRYNGIVILELEEKYYQSSKIYFSNFYYLIRNSTYKLQSAFYAAKNLGRNQVHVYQVNDNELVRQRNQIKWAVKIPQALEDNGFCLYY
ncbi:MAG: hypothetical protein F6K18_08150 [Okeania sp. SIO2C2]|uniref:hypothetical protein n=1 Tax=Okeania sp. SIO2C2 TaxID=2607787 RepID=UPI0013BE0A41|nr:hypothetical protein [Okeania sp. SIO2C2]NEP86808.1 hypothetical protein [Okeania sp. SIO2C2]